MEKGEVRWILTVPLHPVSPSLCWENLKISETKPLQKHVSFRLRVKAHLRASPLLLVDDRMRPPRLCVLYIRLRVGFPLQSASAMLLLSLHKWQNWSSRVNDRPLTPNLKSICQDTVRLYYFKVLELIYFSWVIFPQKKFRKIPPSASLVWLHGNV